MQLSMDFEKLFKNISKDFGSNLTYKIGNPPTLKTKLCFCMWSDLLGFGHIFQDNNWILNEELKKQVYERLEAAHSAVLYYSSPAERDFILNDGMGKVFHPQSKDKDGNNILSISLFLRSCIELHISINETEHELELPGCRSVLAFGESIEYIADDIRYDDYVMNYSKPAGSNISNFAKRTGNPIVVYNPKELQMNTAFSKAYLLEAGGTKAGLHGNHFFIDESSIRAITTFAIDKGYTPIWEEREEGLCLFVPYKRDIIDEVVMGFCFDKEIIIPKDVRYKTKVYRLKRYYPNDEKTIDFYFDLEQC